MSRGIVLVLVIALLSALSFFMNQADAADVCWKNADQDAPLESVIITITDLTVLEELAGVDGNPRSFVLDADLGYGCDELDAEIGCDSCEGKVLGSMINSVCYQLQFKVEGDAELSPITDHACNNQAVCHGSNGA